jgi:hypothetical protein
MTTIREIAKQLNYTRNTIWLLLHQLGIEPVGYEHSIIDGIHCSYSVFDDDVFHLLKTYLK